MVFWFEGLSEANNSFANRENKWPDLRANYLSLDILISAFQSPGLSHLLIEDQFSHLKIVFHMSCLVRHIRKA